MEMANLALEGGDPRLNATGEGVTNIPRPIIKALHDPSITFEEFTYYAELSRAHERELESASTNRSAGLLNLFPGLKNLDLKRDGANPTPGVDPKPEEDSSPIGAGTNGEKKALDGPAPATPLFNGEVTPEEWSRAARAARTATWGAVFYLITTDILGPFSVPWALAQMGWGPGIVLYFIFGVFSAYAGWMIWQMFLSLDSEHYPLKTYGDIAFRIYGRVARHAVNILQSIQLLFNVGVLVLSNGQALSQVASNKVCFVALCVIFTCCGFLVGQIRTLQRFGGLANLAIWLNVLVMCITMGVVANSAPNYIAAGLQNMQKPGPVVTTAGPPSSVAFTGQVVGLMQAVYSYGGAMLFTEFMAEMRHPWDFWKALVCAEAFIFSCYIFFGAFVYGHQGQYTINPANQGISPYAWQTAGNMISIVSALIAACLYGNIGVKVIYQNVLLELCGFPPLDARNGKLLWIGVVPVYWWVAFVIGVGIPQVSTVSGIVSAVCIMQFTYTFPPLLFLGQQVQLHARLPGEGFNPVTGAVTRLDGGWKRWRRGIATGWPLKLFNLLFFLGAATTAVLGMYSSITGIISAFQDNPSVSSFGCQSPVA